MNQECLFVWEFSCHYTRQTIQHREFLFLSLQAQLNHLVFCFVEHKSSSLWLLLISDSSVHTLHLKPSHTCCPKQCFLCFFFFKQARIQPGNFFPFILHPHGTQMCMWHFNVFDTCDNLSLIKTASGWLNGIWIWAWVNNYITCNS